MLDYFFDQLSRDLARGGSRREFVRRSAGFTAVAGLAQAGMPARWARPVAKLFGVPAPCESDLECGNCEDCRHWYGADVKTCGFLCQAKCSTCSGGQCVDTCPTCTVCHPNTEQAGATCVSLEDLVGCKSCEPKTGKLTDKCSTCEKCVGKECVTNCPGRCETCDNGTCRKCGDKPCEYCAETGRCYTCDPGCQRCNSGTGECESTCKNGLACCGGKCLNCCGSCDAGGTCGYHGADAECRDDAKNPACCGPHCHDLDSDSRHCGACYHNCGWHQRCDHGGCVCEGVLESGAGVLGVRGGGMECSAKDHECCEGNCVDMAAYQSDPKHCGKCIVQCEPDERCERGECVGSKRVGYSIRYRIRYSSKELGVTRDVMFTATVRRLAKPDADGNTYAGWGTFSGVVVNHKVNCANKAPMDWEPIRMDGRAKGTATVDPLGGGKLTLIFTITPLNPPKQHMFTKSFRGFEGAAGMKYEDLPDAVLPVVGALQVSAGFGKDEQKMEMPGGSCQKTIEMLNEWDAAQVQ